MPETPRSVRVAYTAPYGNNCARALELSPTGNGRVKALTDSALLFGRALEGQPIFLPGDELDRIWPAVREAIAGKRASPVRGERDHMHGAFRLVADYGGENHEATLHGADAICAIDALTLAICQAANLKWRPMAGLWHGADSPVEFFNPHPDKLSVPDCVKRTCCAITGLAYKDVSAGLNALKRETGARAFNHSANTDALVKLAGAKVLTLGAGSMPETAGHFARKHAGAWIVSTKGHWVACVDHALMDSWDSSEEPIEEAHLIDPGVLAEVLLAARARQGKKRKQAA